MSHPLIVDAAQTLFVPVAVYNNIKGRDEQTLKSFDEPSWNNPVVRILSHERKMLAPRVAGDYTVGGLARAMTQALRSHKSKVPRYLELLVDQERVSRPKLEQATFAMHCFWQGELSLGSVPGVVHTWPGFLHGNEVVEVEYDPQRVQFDRLLDRAQQLKCATTVYTRTDEQQRLASKKVGRKAVRTNEKSRPDSQPKYYLFKSPMRYVPLTRLQKIHVNRALAKGGDPLAVLSPQQTALLRLVRANPDAGWPSAVENNEFLPAWNQTIQIASKVSSKSD